MILLIRHGIFSAARYIFDAYAVVPRLLQRAGGERRVTNLYHLLELSELQIAKQHLAPPALLRWMQRMRQDPSEVASEARQLRIESDEQSVVITTIHRSKGLEYPFVFCPFLWADSAALPHKDEIITYFDDESDQWVADLRGKNAPMPALVAAEREREAENLRLIYVAITRAIHGATVYLPQVRGLRNTTLGRFLCRLLQTHGITVDEPFVPELRRKLKLLEYHAGANLRLVDAVDAPRASDARVPQIPRQLTIKPLTRRISNSWVASSFSAMIAGLPVHTLSTDEEAGKDVDARPAQYLQDFGESARARFSALPPGASSGDTLHKILQCIDFVNFDPASDTIVEPLLTRLGLDSSRDLTSVQQDLAAVLDAPLLPSDSAFRLRSVDFS